MSVGIGNPIRATVALPAIIDGGMVVSTTIYTAGDTVGGILTLTDAVRYSGGIATIDELKILDADNQKAPFTVLLFNASPAAAITTDNAAFAFGTDFGKCVGQLLVAATDYTTTDGKAVVDLRGLACHVQPTTGRDLFAVLVTTGTPTYTATTSLVVKFVAVKD